MESAAIFYRIIPRNPLASLAITDESGVMANLFYRDVRRNTREKIVCDVA
jgi:hypothetical protein